MPAKSENAPKRRYRKSAKYGDGSIARAALAQQRRFNMAREEFAAIAEVFRVLDGLKPQSRTNVLRFVGAQIAD